MQPIQVESGGNYFMMIAVSGTNGILVDPAGAITSVALGSITVTDVNIVNKAAYLNK
jgi:hypothetical protein